MKKATVLMVAFLVSIPLGLAAQSETPRDGYYAQSYARLNYVKGNVFVQRASDSAQERAEVNLVLVRGDKLGTEAGQAEIQFGRRNYLRLNDYSRVEFAALPVAGDDRVKVHVLEGSAYLRVGELAGEKAIEIHTPDASAYILEEGLYRFNVNPGAQTEVIVLEGSLEAAGEEGSQVVRGRQSLFASDGRLLGEPADFAYGSDGFDRWNESRDALFARRSTTRYLPSDLDQYEEELDANGHWAYEQPYGYVWIPYGIDDGWRPYMYGRWSWYAGLGWNWVSSEPWGWSVYHYGRWHWRFGLGWYWIPRLEWGPAWVHWWWDNDYYGWCPLSWYDRPVVIIGNTFHDRYRDHYFPGHNRAMSVIPRDRLQARDVGRHMLRGGELNRIDRVQLRAEQPAGRPSIDRGSLRSPETRGAISSRSGLRGEARTYPSGGAVSSSRLRSGGADVAGRTGRVSQSASGTRGVVERPSSVRSSAAGRSTSERGIRTYPRDGSGDVSRGGSVAGERSMRTYPSRSRDASPSVSRPSSSSERSTRSGSSPSVRSYPSRTREDQSSGSGRIRSYSGASPSSRSYSRPSSPSSSSESRSPRYNPRTYSYSGPSSSSSKSSAPRYSAPSQSRGSFSAPSSRSGGSYSAPSRSGGARSSGAPKVSGSTSSPSRSSSSRSSSSSSSSGSSRSGSRRK